MIKYTKFLKWTTIGDLPLLTKAQNTMCTYSNISGTETLEADM